MKTSIFPTLEKLGLSSKETRVLFNERTRDVEGLKVWRDSVSGVIYIDDFYTGDDAYTSSKYKAGVKKTSFEILSDAERRLTSLLPMATGKDILDFGCGVGDFLRKIQPYSNSVCGVELQQSCVDGLNADRIECFTDVSLVDDASIDLVTSFHVVEHLPNPLDILKSIKPKLREGGMFVVEVPHANDFLLNALPVEAFKQFTLWSPHLVLHTRSSLKTLLQHSGFEVLSIEGVQRYPLSNHLNWLANGKPGGHLSFLSRLDSPALRQSYEDSLASINATDTIVAIAKRPSQT